jgi:hypothetical protein
MVPPMADEPLDETQIELIQALCLEAGRIMEDASPDLALALPSSRDLIAAQVDRLWGAADEIMALANAARALVR